MLKEGNKPTAASYTSMIAALEFGAKYGIEGCPGEAKSLLSEMREAGMGGGCGGFEGDDCCDRDSFKRREG